MGIRANRLVKGDLGIEIEVEGRNLPTRVPLWRTEVDGSLKGEESIEYVLQTPSSLEGVRDALNNLNFAYKSFNSRVDDTVRAGVHVHVNCQKLTMTQLYNFMTLYLLLENVLVKWCGDYREGNLFCLRACDADYLLAVIQAATEDDRKRFRQHFQTDDIRYASMNLKALGDYGSLEFRAMRGTRDLDLIYTWAETLLGLREFSSKFNSPNEIIESFSIDGPINFMRNALGKNFDVFFDKDTEELLHQGMRSAQDIAYCTDWHKFEPKMKKIGNLEFPEDVDAPDEPLEDF